MCSSDLQLPKHAGQYYVKDPYSGQVMLVDTNQFSKRYTAAVNKHEEYVYEVFRRAKSSCIKVMTTQDYFRNLVHFFKKLVKMRER